MFGLGRVGAVLVFWKPGPGKPEMKDKRSPNKLSLVGRSLTLHRQKSSFGRARVCSLKMFALHQTGKQNPLATFYKESNHIKQFGGFIHFPGSNGTQPTLRQVPAPVSGSLPTPTSPFCLAQPHTASDGPGHPLKALANKEKLASQLPQK